MGTTYRQLVCHTTAILALFCVASTAALAQDGERTSDGTTQLAQSTQLSAASASESLPDSPGAPRASLNDAAVTYIRPSERTKLRNYFLDGWGPFPILAAAFSAGVNQANNTPPEWKQGAEAYGKRIGSNFGIAVVGTTTKYALAEALREDTLYYRCECNGVLPRVGHAFISTLTARTGNDGHRVFSIAALVAPYAGTMTAVYGWYPDRYDAKDAFRMGNYVMIGQFSGNLFNEFLGGGRKLPFFMRHSSPQTEPNP